MKRLILAASFAILSLFCFAQEEQVGVAADRPGVLMCPDITPFKKVQWETGFECAWMEGHSLTLPTTIFRFGVTRFAELRLEYDGLLTRPAHSSEWSYEVCPLSLGTRIKIFDGYKWIPKIALTAEIAIPVTRTQVRETHVAPSLHLSFQNEVTDWFYISYNVGADWDGVTAIPATALGAFLGFNITDSFGAFVESYNYFTQYGIHHTEVECDLDFGFYYLVHPKVQLDLYAGFNCQDPRTMSFVGLGVAWMIN